MKKKKYINILINNYINSKYNKYVYLIIKYLNIKLLIFLIISLIIYYLNERQYLLNEKYNKFQININQKFNSTIRNKLRIGIYSYCLINGGRARITSLLVKYFHEIEVFKIILFTVLDKQENDYKIPKDIERFTIKTNFVKILRKKKIDILIYELDDLNEISILNNITDIKIIFYQHSSNYDWIYSNYTIYKNIYKLFKNSKYFVTIVPIENEFLFKKWGIRSILMDNFMTYKFGSVIPSDLTSKNILMIGRGKAKKKRFQIGIEAMEYISKELSKYEMKIISDLTSIEHLQILVINLNLPKYIQFVGFNINPEIFFQNSSLNIFPSISEAFPMVIIETKMFGIPNILLGLDYITISNGGTVIIYDDTSETLAKEAIKILKSNNFRKELGKKAKRSMKRFNNELLKLQWIEVMLLIYNGDHYYEHFREERKYKILSEKEAFHIIHNQVKLLKMRDNLTFNNISFENYADFNYMENLKKKID